MERPGDAKATFKRRYASYDSESSWVLDPSLIDPLLEGVAAGDSVLDVCSGTGAVARRSESRGHQVVAVDLTLEMLRANPVERRVVASGSVLPLKGSAVDRVCCRQGLHYLDLDTAVAEFRRVARETVSVGQIVMLAPADLAFWKAYFDLASPGRLHIFALGDLPSILLAGGLTVVADTTVENRGSLLGPIRHLAATQRQAIRRMFTDDPVARRYQVREAGDDLTYTQVWQFVTAAV